MRRLRTGEERLALALIERYEERRDDGVDAFEEHIVHSRKEKIDCRRKVEARLADLCLHEGSGRLDLLDLGRDARWEKLHCTA